MFYIEHKMRLNIFPVNFLLVKKIDLHTIELRIEKKKKRLKIGAYSLWHTCKLKL